jgi:hypothetical protein
MKGIHLVRLLAVAAVAVLAVAVAGAARSGTIEPKPLAGLTNDQTVYLAAGGEWHHVSALQFKAAGLSQHAIMWYDNHLPGTMGAPATNEQVAQASADYQKTLEDLGVATKPTTPVVPSTPSVPVTVKPVISTGTALHAAKAGHPFVVNFQVTRSDNGDKLMSGTMVSNPSVNGKTIYPHLEKFQDGLASVLFTVPKLASGKTLTVPVTIKSGTETTRQVETFQVG